MSKPTRKSNNNIIKSLRNEGFITPIDNEEIVHFESLKYKELGIDPMPYNLPSSEQILNVGHIEADPAPVSKNKIAEDLARAAREGKDIPQNILELMERDRNNAERQ